MAVLEARADTVVADLDWQEFYENLKPRVTGLLQRYRIPKQDAEDILHDTLLLFLTKHPTVDEPSLWILATLKRRCGMYWREHHRRLHRPFEPAVLEAIAKPVAPEQHKVAFRCDLERAMDRMPEKRRRLLEARYLDGRTPAETARLLGYRPSGIYKVLDRGVARLAREIETRGSRAKNG